MKSKHVVAHWLMEKLHFQSCFETNKAVLTHMTSISQNQLFPHLVKQLVQLLLQLSKVA